MPGVLNCWFVHGCMNIYHGLDVWLVSEILITDAAAGTKTCDASTVPEFGTCGTSKKNFVKISALCCPCSKL
jgi:hypothetical protein